MAIIPPGQTGAALDPMPLEALRLSAGVLDLLEQLGVRRIGELALLPRADFNARFGPELLQAWDRATGRLDEPISALPLPWRFEAEQFFEFPTDRRLALEAALEQLVGRVAMAAFAGAALYESMDVSTARMPGVYGSTSACLPHGIGRHLFALLRMRLQQLALPGRWRWSRRDHGNAQLENGQAEHRPRQAARRAAAELVDRLASRLGRGAVWASASALSAAGTA